MVAPISPAIKKVNPNALLVVLQVKPASPVITALNPNADVFHSACQNETVDVELDSTSSTHWSEPSLSDLAVTNITPGNFMLALLTYVYTFSSFSSKLASQ